MLTLLFGVDVLISSWITALFLGILLAFFFGQTQIYQSIIELIEATYQNRLCKHCVRWTARMAVVLLFSAVLGILINLEPAPGRGLSPLFDLIPSRLLQGRNALVLDDVEVTVTILFLLFVVPVTNKIFASLYQSIETWGHNHFRTIRIQKLDLLTRSQIATALIQVVKTTRYLLLFLVFTSCILTIMSLYALTSGMSKDITEWLLGMAESLWDGFLAFLPNLIILIAITMLTRMALRVMGFFYDAIWKGKIQVNTLHHELVEPTYQLLRLLVIAFALVAAFPYIPGSSSPVFKAISIFVGFLLSLGSTSLASNIVSGIVLTYTRGLKVGDRVQVADSVGDVIDRTLLVTRIRTIKNVVITLPNAMVMQNQVINFSADAEVQGLVLHTSVTIGYDVPWRQVDHLLVQAALKTPEILEYPAPFVLKTSLDDYYISYQLNAYTEKAQKMAVTYSILHENILDEFNREGVEIMSPAYMALRDGQQTTIPETETTENNGQASGNGYAESGIFSSTVPDGKTAPRNGRVPEAGSRPHDPFQPYND